MSLLSPLLFVKTPPLERIGEKPWFEELSKTTLFDGVIRLISSWFACSS